MRIEEPQDAILKLSFSATEEVFELPVEVDYI